MTKPCIDPFRRRIKFLQIDAEGFVSAEDVLKAAVAWQALEQCNILLPESLSRDQISALDEQAERNRIANRLAKSDLDAMAGRERPMTADEHMAYKRSEAQGYQSTAAMNGLTRGPQHKDNEVIGVATEPAPIPPLARCLVCSGTGQLPPAKKGLPVQACGECAGTGRAKAVA